MFRRTEMTTDLRALLIRHMPTILLVVGCAQKRSKVAEQNCHNRRLGIVLLLLAAIAAPVEDGHETNP